jgi:hypothetical protein
MEAKFFQTIFGNFLEAGNLSAMQGAFKYPSILGTQIENGNSDLESISAGSPASILG